MRYIANAFSLAMVSNLPKAHLEVEEISPAVARDLARGATSCVGHLDTALIFTDVLGVTIGVNRFSARLKRGDSVVVGQYSGPRLPEGSTSLPEGAQITWYEVRVW